MPTLIPHASLKPETLTAVIEEFVTRDGAVHGHSDTPVDRQIEAVRRLLTSGKAAILFDEESESCTIAMLDAKGNPVVERESKPPGGSGRKRREEGDGGEPERRFVPDEG